MTVTERRLPQAGRVGRRLCLTAAVATLIGAVAVPAAADAATDAPAVAAEVSLNPSVQGRITAEGGLVASATIGNTGDAPLPPAVATLEIGSPLADRAALEEWLDPAADELDATAVASTTVDEIPAGGEAEASLSAPSSVPALSDLAPGVYPIRASYGGAGGRVTSDSVAVVPGDQQIAAGMVVPITAPPTRSGLLTSDQISTLTAPDGSLTAQLRAVAGTTAVVAIDPAIPAAIRALGSSAPADAREWLELLDSLPNERITLQFGDADVAAQLEAGLGEPLQPENLDTYLNEDDFAPATEDAPSPTPSPTEDPPSQPALPDLDELLDIGDATDGVYWPQPGTVTPGTLEALRATDPGAVVLTPSTSTDAGAGGGGVPARAEGMLAYDTMASRTLNSASDEPDPAERARLHAEAFGQLWFSSQEAGSSPLLVALDRDAQRDESALRSTIEAVTRNTSVSVTTLRDLLAAPPAAMTATGEPDAERTDAVTTFLSDEERVAPIATALEEPGLLTGRERAETLQLLGVGWTAQPSDWRDALEAHASATRDVLTAVQVQSPSPVQLISAEAPLPVWVRNDLPYPVNVTLFAHPDDVRLEVETATEVAAQPSSNTRVQVPVRARLANGTVHVSLELRSAEGHLIGPPQSMPVTVRAEWERIGIVILGVLVVLLVTIGVIRTVRRRRRARAHGEGEAESDGVPGSDRESDDGSGAEAGAEPGDDAADDGTGDGDPGAREPADPEADDPDGTPRNEGDRG